MRCCGERARRTWAFRVRRSRTEVTILLPYRARLNSGELPLVRIHLLFVPALAAEESRPQPVESDTDRIESDRAEVPELPGIPEAFVSDVDHQDVAVPIQMRTTPHVDPGLEPLVLVAVDHALDLRRHDLDPQPVVGVGEGLSEVRLATRSMVGVDHVALLVGLPVSAVEVELDQPQRVDLRQKHTGQDQREPLQPDPAAKPGPVLPASEERRDSKEQPDTEQDRDCPAVKLGVHPEGADRHQPQNRREQPGSNPAEEANSLDVDSVNRSHEPRPEDLLSGEPGVRHEDAASDRRGDLQRSPEVKAEVVEHDGREGEEPHSEEQVRDPAELARKLSDEHAPELTQSLEPVANESEESHELVHCVTSVRGGVSLRAAG